MATTFAPARDDTHMTSSTVQPLLQVSLVRYVCGQPSADPKFHNLRALDATYPSTHARA
jgi:hypothetical protein